MKASQAGSLIAGISFMLSGYLLSVHNTLSMLLSVIWVPLFFLCYFSSIKNNNLSHAILSGIVGTLMFLGGGVEACYLAFGTAFLLTLFPELVLNNFIKIRRRLAFFGIFCTVFFGLTAVQLIPFLELSQLSIRTAGLSYGEAGTWSLHPYDLVEFFVPDLYGLGTDIKKYWTFQNWLKTIYMGGIPFILAIFFLKKWDKRTQGFLLLFFISLGLAMGKNALFHQFLFDYLPFFNKLRYPVKFIFLAVLILSVAAGLGYDYYKKLIEENSPESKQWVLYMLILGFFFMIVFGALSIFNEPLITYLKTTGWGDPKYNEIEVNIFNFKRFLVFSSLFCLGLFFYSKPNFKNSFALVGIIALLVLDMFFAHFNFYQIGDLKQIEPVGENAKFIQSDPDLFRIFVTPKTLKETVEIKENWKGLDIRKEKFMMGLLGNQRILDVNGIAVTRQERWEKMMSLIKTAPAIDSTNLLNMMNVKYVVSTPQITSPDYKLVHSYDPIPQDLNEKEELEKSSIIKIYENQKMLPHAFLVPQCKILNSEDEYKRILESKTFNPEKVVLLDAEPENFSCDNKGLPDNQEWVTMDSYKSNTLELSVNSREERLLFLSDSYFPGWKAYVNGKKTPIHRANYLFRAIVIEPGKHKVRFEYDPFSFKLGLVITLLSILICGITFFKYRIRENI
ncbi:MAG: YfhO family protein [Nitrospina sp.]|nr:YfhO family protein [Nitrospina sp.]